MVIVYKKKYKDVSWPAIEPIFAAISLFRNRLLSRATKIRLYKADSSIWSGNMEEGRTGSANFGNENI
jgi:hypothetical protein